MTQRCYDLAEYREWVERRKVELGITNSAELIEALRNKGLDRTPEKREGLRLAHERAIAAGVEPIKAYY